MYAFFAMFQDPTKYYMYRYTTNVINIEYFALSPPVIAESVTDLTNESNFAPPAYVTRTHSDGFVVDDGRPIRFSPARYRSLTSSFDF